MEHIFVFVQQIERNKSFPVSVRFQSRCLPDLFIYYLFYHHVIKVEMFQALYKIN